MQQIELLIRIHKPEFDLFEFGRQQIAGFARQYVDQIKKRLHRNAHVEPQLDIVAHNLKVRKHWWPEKLVAISPGEQVAIVDLPQRKLINYQ